MLALQALREGAMAVNKRRTALICRGLALGSLLAGGSSPGPRCIIHFPERFWGRSQSYLGGRGRLQWGYGSRLGGGQP